MNDFKGRHFPGEIVLWAVRSLSTQISELPEVRSVFVAGGSYQGGITNAKLDIDLGGHEVHANSRHRHCSG